MSLVRLATALLGAFAALPSLVRAQEATAAGGEAPAQVAQAAPVSIPVDTVSIAWVLICAALVFLMQSGFLAFEIGLVRRKNAPVTAIKNLADWMVVGLFFFLVGYALMFGTSQGGYVGSSMFLGQGVETAPAAPGGATHLGWAFFIFQLAFCGTAMTIVSGAVAERTGMTAYLIFGVVMAVAIYPVFGHWVWGSLYLGTDNAGWLARLGFRDFAGSAVVHGIGGWSALAAIQVIGPRMGRYTTDGKLMPLDSHGVHWSAFGTLILWFCWWGFNGGSTLALNGDVGRIIVNTNIAGSAAAMVGFLHAVSVQKRRAVEEKLIGSALAGLVAVTACADVISPVSALAVGAGAAVVHNHALEFVTLRLKLDDVVGAIPVHAFAGVWGCLCVALFGDQAMLPHPRWHQLGIQALGCLVCGVWAYVLSFACFKILKATVGVRVDPMKEIEGLTLSAVEEEAPAHLEGEDPEYDELLAEIRDQFDADERFDQY